MTARNLFITFVLFFIPGVALAKSVCTAQNCESCSEQVNITWNYWLPYNDFPDRPVKIIFKRIKLNELDNPFSPCDLNEILKSKFDTLHRTRSMVVVLIKDFNDNFTFSLPFDGGLNEFLKADLIESLSIFGAKISSGDFCSLKHLNTLRLEINGLSNFQSIGCDGELQCCNSIQRLILKQNNYDITKPEKGKLENLTNLEIRSIVRSIEESALTDLKNLKEFSIRFASLKSPLPSRLFPVTINKIHIDYTNINSIPENLFKNLHNLTHLTLSKNEISFTNDTCELFKDLENLEYLELSNNGLVAIPENIFSYFKLLEVLDLNHNKINFNDETTSDIFKGLSNLKVLDLSWNAIDTLKGSFFENIKTLEILKLEHNKLTHLEPEWFIHLQHLMMLSLRSNKLLFSPRTLPIFGALTNLRTLDLRRNRLLYLSENIFSGLVNLERLDLSFNLIKSINESSFKSLGNLKQLLLDLNEINSIGEEFGDLHSLEELQLGFNIIANISDGVLCNSSSLNFIDLRENSLKSLHYRNEDGDITSHFSCLQQLKTLKLSRNKIEKFDYSMIPPSLISLELSSNKISSITDRNSDRFHLNLTYLDVSKNLITSLSKESFPPTIQFIDLYNNDITYIDSGTFETITNLKKISLLLTAIQGINRFALGQNSTTWSRFKNVNFHITADENKLKKFTTSQSAPLSSEVDSNDTQSDPVKCFENVKYRHFGVASYNNNNFKKTLICQRKDYALRQKCDTHNISVFNHLSLDCGFQYVEDLPEDLPKNTTVLLIDGGNVTLHSHFFTNFNSLQYLYLNDSNIQHLDDDAFEGLTNLIELHLEDNDIQNVSVEAFSHLKSLRRMYISQSFHFLNLTSELLIMIPSLELLDKDALLTDIE